MLKGTYSAKYLSLCSNKDTMGLVAENGLLGVRWRGLPRGLLCGANSLGTSLEALTFNRLTLHTAVAVGVTGLAAASCYQPPLRPLPSLAILSVK